LKKPLLWVMPVS